MKMVSIPRARVGLVSMVLAAVSVAGTPMPASAFQATLPPSQTVAGTISEDQIVAAIEKLDTLAQRILNNTKIPGMSVAVVWRGKTVYAKGFGLRRVGGGGGVDADTVFQIASLSKPIAASVVARQVGEGVVTWDTPVKDHLPWFSLADPWVTEHVTIGDFFAHRSGLPDHGGDDLEDLGYDRKQILERLRFLPLSPFRSTYAYTNFGLTAAAEAVAQASGMDWASLSQKAIYGPLGMSSTSSRYADYVTRENRAFGHILKSGRYEPIELRQPDAQSPAGGVSSNVTDFARWMAMVLENGKLDGRIVVDKAALLQAITGHIVSSPARVPSARSGLYGYGFNVSTQPSGRVAISHSGAFYLGTATNFVLLPSENLGIVAFSNATPIGAVEALTAAFMDFVQFGEATRDWLAGYRAQFAQMTSPLGELSGKAPPENPAPSGELAGYVGSYGNAYFGGAKVELLDGGLVLELGPAGQRYPLRHWSGETFYFAMFTENAPDGSVSAVTFDEDGGGPPNSMTIELLNENGLGTFTRRHN